MNYLNFVEDPGTLDGNIDSTGFIFQAEITGNCLFDRREDLIQSYLSCLLCSPLVCLLVSIIIFNSWCNLMAETTRFGDREFYQVMWSGAAPCWLWLDLNCGPLVIFLITKAKFLSEPATATGFNNSPFGKEAAIKSYGVN